MDEDLYAILGVLPDAEQVVVIAAYRALAQRYHPDKWTGDPEVAHERTSRLNVAFQVLGDAVKRASYDRRRSLSSQAQFQSDEQEQSTAFEAAMSAVGERWDLACGVYPDLRDTRQRLARISTSLAFSFVVCLLETKAFAQRVQVAEHLEHSFMQRYFGTNAAVLAFAHSLVMSGERAAARFLNQLVEVVGSDGDAGPIIERVNREFNLRELAKAREAKRAAAEALAKLKNTVRSSGHYLDSVAVAKALGYAVQEFGTGLFSSPEIEITSPDGSPLPRFKNTAVFVHWVRQNLCS